MPAHLLVIDDDRKLNRLLRDYLGDFGFKVATAATPAEGMQKLRRQPPDLVILDVMLPGQTGFEVCKEIRQHSAVPIIMLTARGEAMDRIVGLELGADDYMAKPFEPRELVARIQAVLRRMDGRVVTGELVFANLRIDLERRLVWLDDSPVDLTTNEFTILVSMARRPGKVMDRDRLLQELKGMDSEAFNRTVDITMSRLRQKLADDPKFPRFIKTVWGAGYVFIGKAPDHGNTV
jgi:DNA-binding response OmpR family regulator